jgi:hypothetical protein
MPPDSRERDLLSGARIGDVERHAEKRHLGTVHLKPSFVPAAAMRLKDAERRAR